MILVQVAKRLIVWLAVAVLAIFTYTKIFPSSERILTGPEVLEAVKHVNKHIFVEHYITVDIDYEHVPVEWLKAILHQRFVVLLHGRVPAGFDLQGLTVKDNIQVKGKKVILHLPPPQVFEENVSIDFNNSRILYVSSQCLFFCTESAEIYQSKMLPEAQKRLVEAALKNDILRQAATYGKSHYEALLRSLGFEDVTVVVTGYKL
jgi:hypothetical protein